MEVMVFVALVLLAFVTAQYGGGGYGKKLQQQLGEIAKRSVRVYQLGGEGFHLKK